MADPTDPLGEAPPVDAETLPAPIEPLIHCSTCRCALDAATAKHRGGRALTEARIAIFLEKLAESRSPSYSASCATPWAQGKDGGANTLYDERRRDPAFAAAWDRAEQHFLGRVESAITKRALEPPTRPHFDKNGTLIGTSEDRNSSDRLLLRLAARHDRAWSERSTVEHEQALVAANPKRKRPARQVETLRSGLFTADQIDQLRARNAD
jgi:hypothetical protein